jgi:DNA mismatch repair ATPase MutS
MKAVLDIARNSQGRAFFLLDEILLGTNARERQTASQQIIRLLLKTGAIGAIATHDLTLATLEQDPSATLHNVHFRDQLVDGRMLFDYHIHEGIVQGSNALRLLHEAGIDIEDTKT